MTKTFLIGVGLIGAAAFVSTAYALPVQSMTLQYVYGTGWAVNDGWLTPMTEVAADAVAALETAKTTKATCDVKGVFKTAEWNEDVVDFLAYDIENCK